MNRPVLTGVSVALVTFFDDHGRVDGDATARHAHHLVERGVQGVVVAGTTGEASHLSMKERLALLDKVRAEVAGPTPVVLGVGALAPGASSAELAKRAGDHGADAVIALSPHHGDIRAYFEELAGVSAVPVLAYHFPKASPPGIPLELLGDLPVAGLKDSSGDNERLLGDLDAFDGPIYVGNSAQLLLAGQLGCAGAILAAANLEPELCGAAFGGDVAAQRTLLGAHRVAGIDPPVGLKAEMHRRWGTPPHHRSHSH